MKRYRIDVFDREFNYIDMAQTSEPELITDALVQTSSQFSTPKELRVERGNYCQIRSEEGELFQGIITDFSFDGKKTDVTLAQMSKLLDAEVFADVTTLASGIEPWMATQLNSIYAGADTSANLAGLVIQSSTVTPGSYQENDQGIYNLYDLAVHFFKINGVVIDIRFDPVAKQILFQFRTIDFSSVWKIETKLADVADYSVKSPYNMDYPNKMIIRDSEDPSQELVYYWHPTEFSGTVDQDGTTNRVIPVVARCATVTPEEGQTFQDAAYNQAVNSMYQSRYDDQIEITFNSDSKLVEVGEIGQLYSIIDRGTVYNTVLTGYQRLNDKYTLMTFGYVRKRLTQILQQQRRNNL